MLLNEMIISKKNNKITTGNKIRCAACPLPFTKLIQRFAAALVIKAPTKKYILEHLLIINESSLRSAYLYL